MFIDSVVAVQGAMRGKVAIVTGSGRGIGRESARILARLGAAVVVAEIQEETGRETADLIRRDGGEARFVPVDVSDEASVQRLKDQVLAAYGHADILVNNAIATSFGPIVKTPLAQWDRVMAVNLRGAFLCIKAFLPQMLERKSGVVMLMESSEGMPYLAPYLASKVGLRSLAMSLAQEVGEESGVCVYCFGPGMVDTPGLAEALEQLPKQYGMTREEFIRQSGVSLMSAEVSATGLVGTLLYAREFHGQQTGAAHGLARLGLNGAGEPLSSADEPVAPSAPEPAPGPVKSGLSEALALNLKLEEILEANVREYNELTLFQRPIVKRMFQSATGLKVEDWLEQARAASKQLERGGLARRDEYIALLQKLAQYIKKQETDARGYFRNPEDLKRALTALKERHDVVSGLVACLEAAGKGNEPLDPWD